MFYLFSWRRKPYIGSTLIGLRSAVTSCTVADIAMRILHPFLSEGGTGWSKKTNAPTECTAQRVQNEDIAMEMVPKGWRKVGDEGRVIVTSWKIEEDERNQQQPELHSKPTVRERESERICIVHWIKHICESALLCMKCAGDGVSCTSTYPWHKDMHMLNARAEFGVCFFRLFVWAALCAHPKT